MCIQCFLLQSSSCFLNLKILANQYLFTGSDGWMKLVGLNIDDIVGSGYMTRDIVQPELIHRAIDQSDNSPDIELGIKQSYELSRHSFTSPSFLPTSQQLCKVSRRLNLAPRIHVRPSVFGPGMLISVLDRRVIVTMFNSNNNDGNDVFQNVFSSILSGSEILNIETANEAEEYFFIKEENQYLNDLEELERLSGSFNVTKNSQRGGGEQVCVRNTRHEFSICLLYGVREEKIIRQKLRQTHRSAVKAAWQQEVQRVKLGFHGEWSPSERDELLRNGEVSGYIGEEIHSGHKYPALMGQASNIRFVRESSSQSRYNML